ncbi:uncharacterized protein LOC124699045 [Lolium rigidum]|uniref:uncharacterized protein LOC124699045 n=1 Tax=Lolium rigidum TaxID=89674 RepID=UPI001F5C23D5|nr:uncharacterized protein LOC124699045 [Lolium rigidum]
MDQFQDGQHVWLRSRVRGKYLYARGDGESVRLREGRASLKAAWAVHRHVGIDGVEYVLLHSAAYGRYLAATDDRAPLHLCGYRVVLQNYDQDPMEAIRWQAVIPPGAAEDDVLLRQVRRGHRYLRANGKIQRWIKGVSVDDPQNITTMMHWVVEPIPAMQGMPALPPPTARDRHPGDLSVWLGFSPASIRTIRYVRADDDGDYPELEEVWYALHFTGRSVHRLRGLLRDELAKDDHVAPVAAADLIMCVRAGRHGRLTPLVVNLPHYGDSFQIVLIMDGTPASAELRHPNVNA